MYCELERQDVYLESRIPKIENTEGFLLFSMIMVGMFVGVVAGVRHDMDFER